MIQRFGVIRIPKRFFESEEIPNISPIIPTPLSTTHKKAHQTLIKQPK